MSTSGFADKRVIAIAVLIGALGALWACDYLGNDRTPQPAATQSAATPAATQAAPSPTKTAPPPAGGAASAALDIDGDGQADSARIARVGYYAVSDPIAFKAGSDPATPLEVNWNEDAVVIKLASGGEKAINFGSVSSIAALRAGDAVARHAQSLGCTVPPSGQSLLAEGESGSMILHTGKDGLVAEACSE